uniref:Uncharacterized protein n=1 Tax=Plectus sambesii TaxID=2011161 RepID=A0A914XSB7_9BILA
MSTVLCVAFLLVVAFAVFLQPVNCSPVKGEWRMASMLRGGMVKKRSVYGPYKHLRGYAFMPKKSYGMWSHLPDSRRERFNFVDGGGFMKSDNDNPSLFALPVQ